MMIDWSVNLGFPNRSRSSLLRDIRVTRRSSSIGRRFSRLAVCFRKRDPLMSLLQVEEGHLTTRSIFSRLDDYYSEILITIVDNPSIAFVVIVYWLTSNWEEKKESSNNNACQRLTFAEKRSNHKVLMKRERETERGKEQTICRFPRRSKSNKQSESKNNNNNSQGRSRLCLSFRLILLSISRVKWFPSESIRAIQWHANEKRSTLLVSSNNTLKTIYFPVIVRLCLTMNCPSKLCQERLCSSVLLCRWIRLSNLCIEFCRAFSNVRHEASMRVWLNSRSWSIRRIMKSLNSVLNSINIDRSFHTSRRLLIINTISVDRVFQHLRLPYRCSLDGENLCRKFNTEELMSGEERAFDGNRCKHWWESDLSCWTCTCRKQTLSSIDCVYL